MQHQSGIIGSIDANKPINVIGAGVSGLLLSYHLKKNGFKVHLFDKGPKAGGKIFTIQNEYGIQETGANAIYSDDNIWTLLDELNLKPILPSKNLKKKIYRDNKPNPPIKFFEILKIIPKLFKKVPQKKDLTVFEFFSPLLGENLAHLLLGSVMNGVYATDIKRLHFHSIFKNGVKNKRYFHFVQSLIVQKKSQKKPKLSLSFKNGMGDFITALQGFLADDLSLETEVNLEELENTIICTEAPNAAKLLKDQFPEVATELKKIKYIGINSRTVITSKPCSDLDLSFGVLFPPKLNQVTLGVLNNSAIFENRTRAKNHFSYTVISQNFGKDNNFSDLKELNELNINFTNPNPLHSEVVEWEVGLPIYDYNRFITMNKIRKLFSKQSGLGLFGNYVDGISIREMNTIAKEFAENLSTAQKKNQEQ